MASKYFFSLSSIKPQKSYDGGSLTSVTSKEVPGFVNISFASLKLGKRGVLEPIWHPNANKIGHCLKGSALVSIRGPNGNDVFTVSEGDVFFIPKGYAHHIENIDGNESVINFALNHSQPETMYLSKAMDSISGDVFTATFNESPNFLDGLKKAKNQESIKTLPPLKKEIASIPNRNKFNITASNKPIYTKGGYLQLATKTNLPVLQGLGILGFGLNPKGVVEPHWHTNAGELVYIVKGQTRITVLSPDGEINDMKVNAGEGAFAPASHFHNIENVGKEDVEVIAFFNSEDPDYIGLGEVIGSYNNDLLTSLFSVTPNYFDKFEKPSRPLVIVPL